MNKLSLAKRAQILAMLCEGSSMRSISRVADVSINTVSKLLVEAGEACAAFHDANVHGVKAKRIQVDEIWSFCLLQSRRTSPTGEGRAAAGRATLWTWTAIDADTQADRVSYLVGGRDSEYAMWFMDDTAAAA